MADQKETNKLKGIQQKIEGKINNLLEERIDLSRSLQSAQSKINDLLQGGGGIITDTVGTARDLTFELGTKLVRSLDESRKAFITLSREGVKTFANISKAIAASGIGAIVIGLTAIGGTLLTVVARTIQLQKVAQGVGKEFGFARNQMVGLLQGVNMIGQSADDVAATFVVLGNQFGALPKAIEGSVQTVIDLTNRFKFSADEAGGLLTLLIEADDIGGSLSDRFEGLQTIFENNADTIRDVRQVALELSKLSPGIRAAYRGQTEELVRQVALVKSIGISFERARDVARGLLDIESSLEAQFELEQLTGRALNLDEIRRIAVTSPADAAKALSEQLGPLVNTNNVFIQDAISKLGLSFDEVAKSQEMASTDLSNNQIKRLENLQTQQEVITENIGATIQDAIGKLTKVISDLNDRISQLSFFGKDTEKTVTLAGTAENVKEGASLANLLSPQGPINLVLGALLKEIQESRAARNAESTELTNNGAVSNGG